MKRIGGIILAGGKSSRMGQDKAFMKHEGRMLIEYSLHLAKYFCDSIIISANSNMYLRFAYPVVGDEFEACGPVGGIYSALKKAEFDWNLLISCDTPFVTKALVERLIQNIGNYDCIVPAYGDWNEPLVALYNKSALKVIEGSIRGKEYKLKLLIKKLRTKFVNVSDLVNVNPDIFKNFNSPNDLVF